MSEKEFLKKIILETRPFDLPLGMYLLEKSGEFVDCNSRLREILEFPEGEIRANLKDFYQDRISRERLLKMVDETDPSGSFIENQKICLKVNGRDKWVEFTCRALFNPGNGKVVSNIIGYEGYLRDITKEEGLRNLFEQVPAGVYRLDKDDKFILVNKTLAIMLGYDDEIEILGRTVHEFYAELTLEDKFQEELIDKGFIVNKQVELVKKNGEKILVQVNATVINNYEGQYAGREGIILDVTTEATYKQILNEVPIGTYIIQINDKGEDIITSCNKYFADIFSYDLEDIIGLNILKLYMNPDDHKMFLSDLKEAGINNEPLVGYPIHYKKKDGSEVMIEVHSQLLTNQKGEIIGRVGAVRDISEEVVLWDLREDVGKTLHVYSSTLMMFQHSLQPIKSFLKRAPFDIKEPIFEYDSNTFNELVEILKNNLDELLILYNTKVGSRNSIPSIQYDILNNELKNLKDYKERIKYWILQVPVLHDTAVNISNICDKLILDDKKLDKQISNILKASEDLERFCSIIALNDIEKSVLESDHQVSTFRDYVTFHKKSQTLKESHSIHDIIQQAIEDHRQFARVKKVDLDYEEPSRKYMVRVSKRHLTRAISNLIHNAIKYSWTKQRIRPTVKIQLKVYANDLLIDFSNWGVPITKEELEKELVFQLGYRGIYSGDRGRLGTGIGLPDARQVARQHGGDITITCVSAAGDKTGRDTYKESEKYSDPYLTIVILKLPLERIE